MDDLIPRDMQTILKKDLKKFKSYILDEDYEQFKDYEDEAFFSLYIVSILDNPKVLKKVKKICTDSGIDPKQFNKFIYASMKYIDKLNKGLWSFHECTEFNIPFEDIKQLTLTYTII